jgi:hypothetical protein
MNLLGLPKDILRYILFSHLDGKDGCNLLQTCKFLAYDVVTPHQRLTIRTKPLDIRQRVEEARKKVVICERCFKILDKYHKCLSRKVVDERKYCDLSCCDKRHVLIKLYRPWYQYGRFYFTCITCKVSFDTSWWFGFEYCCVLCGPKCDTCLGLLIQCEYCEHKTLSKMMPIHLSEKHPGILGWISKMVF